MERKYGKMKCGEDEAVYANSLFSIESNLMKIHRKYPDSNSRRLEEAIPLALHFINGKLTGGDADLSRFESEENLRLRDVMLTAFDPFFNEDIAEKLKEKDGEADLADPAFLEEFYRVPVLCILRITIR